MSTSGLHGLQRRIGFLAKLANGFQPLTIFAKSFILDVSQGFECAYGLKIRKIYKPWLGDLLFGFIFETNDQFCSPGFITLLKAFRSRETLV